jgi:hypothetical protein
MPDVPLDHLAEFRPAHGRSGTKSNIKSYGKQADWIQRLVTSGCGGDDVSGVAFHRNGFGSVFVVCGVSIDGSLQIDDADKDAAF